MQQFGGHGLSGEADFVHMDVVLHNKNVGQLNLLHKSPYRPEQTHEILDLAVGRCHPFRDGSLGALGVQGEKGTR